MKQSSKVLEMLFAAQLNPPATPQELEYFQQKLGIADASYLELMKVSNGGFFGDRNKMYSAEEITERTETFEVDKHLPGYCMIGDDSGGTGFIIQKGVAESPVWLTDHGDMALHADQQFPNLYEFLRFANDLTDQPDIPAVTVDVFLVGVPSDGLKGLLRIKSTLGLNTSIVTLKHAAENLPFRLLENVHAEKYQVLCDTLNSSAPCVECKTHLPISPRRLARHYWTCFCDEGHGKVTLREAGEEETPDDLVCDQGHPVVTIMKHPVADVVQLTLLPRAEVGGNNQVHFDDFYYLVITSMLDGTTRTSQRSLRWTELMDGGILDRFRKVTFEAAMRYMDQLDLQKSKG